MRACLVLAAAIAATSVAARADQPMTLRLVMLSQGGVGYFQYDATVNGAATLGLDVPRSQVSDVLTSLVVLDGAGSVDSVVLPSADAAAGVLAGLPVPRSALDRPIDLLNALQGVTVSVTGATPMTGRILHAEPPPEIPVNPGVLDPRLGKTRVTLLGDAGLQQFLLEDVTSVQVADPVLRGKLMAALAALRGSAATEQRHLSIRVAGTGTRTVHLGTVVTAPIWKASYRLVMPHDGDMTGSTAAARLQGWAVIENAGLEDWKDVDLTLQAGNPVAFRQAIYQTYYAPRPEAPVDMLTHPAPPPDTRAEALAARALPAPAPSLAFAEKALAPPSAPASVATNGIQASFALPHPLSLAAGHSASVPFLDRDVAASRLDLLAAEAAHPLAAVRLTNDTGTALPPGLVTLYDTQGFTGNARLGPLPGGESRLLSFAEDLATTAIWHTAHATGVVGVTAARGVLHITRRDRTTTTVDLQAPAAAKRHVVVEIPRAPGTTLSTEPALTTERTAQAWRLDVPLQPAEQRRIVAHADRLVSSSTVLGGDAAPILAVLGEQGLPESARAALQHVADLARNAADRDAARDRLNRQRTAIEQDEARLRANLAAIPATDPLHGQLVRALAADEDSLDRLAAQQREAEAAASRAHQALADAISTLAL